MEIKQTAIFNQEDIARAIDEYMQKRGFSVYVGTFKWSYDKHGDLRELQCEVFAEEQK